MSVTLYDKALLSKFKRWVKDDSLTILGVDETNTLFRYRADINNDQPIQLPLVSLSRNSPVTITSTSKRPLTFDGSKREGNIDRTNQLNAIPITISYQLDIYARYEEEVEEYVRNFIFNIINYNKLEIEIPYKGCNIISRSYLNIQPDIQDNSDISERLIHDQFRRRTINFTLQDAYLYDYKTMDNWKIDTGIEVKLVLDTEEELASGSIDIRK